MFEKDVIRNEADGSSAAPKEPLKERPFSHPLSSIDPPPVDNDDDEGDDEAQKRKDSDPNPRESIFEQMAARVDADRGATQSAADPDDDEDEDGLTPAGDESRPAEGKGRLPEHLQTDPLAEFIVMDGEKPMFRTKVNGQERLVPLDAARAQLQKQIAADLRLQQAAERSKQLDAREQQIQQNEAALRTRLQQAGSPPSSPAGDDADDAKLEGEVRDVVSGLFRGTEDEAAAKLTKLLKKSRAPVAQAPQIDSSRLVEQAVTAVRRQLGADELKRDATEGFKKFSDDYPEILADASLFKYADGMTDTIEAEHPDWKPSQIILEAGRRAKEWVDSLRGDAAPDPAPDHKDRLDRKRQLRPIPRARSGKEQPAPKATPETPGSILAGMRAARGQAA